ncbi:MAG TPA: DUF1349 domain-containing protein [Planctomycetota bacterium]|nr:DUF1349 domain-containing protein [Planctomycetota bacterium]
MNAEQIEYLAERHARGELEPEDIALIAELCRTEEGARQFVEALADYREFRAALAPQTNASEFLKVVVARSEKRGVSGVFVKRVTDAAPPPAKRSVRLTARRKPARVQRGNFFAVPAAIAAMAVLGVLVYFWKFAPDPVPVAQPNLPTESVPAAPTRIARVVALKEPATLKRNGRETPVAANSELFPGDTVVSSGPLQCKYTDEQTFLNTHGPAEFTLETANGAKRIVVVNGTVMADVAAQQQPMVFASRFGEARVLGTELDFGVQRGGSKLNVHSGRVKLTRSADSATLDVNAGFTATAGDASTPLNAHPLALKLPWRSVDVGDVKLPGTVAAIENGYSIATSGADIWEKADGFHFIYQPLSGDGEMIVCVSEMKNVAEFGLGGVMMRESLSADSIHASVLVGTQAKAKFRRRRTTGGDTISTGPSQGNIPLPRWVKLVRKGGQFSASISTDGQKWTEIDSENIKMSRDVFVGVVLTHDSNASRCSATFTDVILKR